LKMAFRHAREKIALWKGEKGRTYHLAVFLRRKKKAKKVSDRRAKLVRE